MAEREIKLHVDGGRLSKPFASPVKAHAPAWSARRTRAIDGPAMLRGMVACCLAQIVPNATEIARGSRDPEHVHQLRVGLRRLRSVACGMRPFATCLPADWEPAIMPVFDALGDARDKHVQSTTLAPRLREAGAPLADLGGPSEEETMALQQLVGCGAFQQVLLRLGSCGEAPADAADRGDKGAGLDHLTRRLSKLMQQVTGHARRFDELPLAQQHQVRKRLKRLRYLAAFAAPAFDRDDVDAWKARVSAAQDRLGEYIDLALAAERFAALAVTEPDAGFAAGWLRAKSEASTRAARKSLQSLADVRNFW